MVLIVVVLDSQYKFKIFKFFYKRVYDNDFQKVKLLYDNLKKVLRACLVSMSMHFKCANSKKMKFRVPLRSWLLLIKLAMLVLIMMNFNKLRKTFVTKIKEEK